MKTIDERAREWVDSQGAGSVHPYNRLAMIDAYIAAYKELARWNDPKEVLPKPHKDVLVKCPGGQIEIDFYSPKLGCFFIEHSTDAKVTGWREIYE